MSIIQNLKREFLELTYVTSYFVCWLGVLILLKHLILAEYKIEFYGMPLAVLGALILAKVVLVLKHVSLGAWIHAQPAWVDVVLRTALYTFGVFVALLIEKTFEARHEYDGFIPALNALFQQADMNHIWINTICLSGALLSYNMLAVVSRCLGKGALLRMFLMPLPKKTLNGD
ncbi:MAG: hypothetical protein ABFS45_20170 [Pseudomonadota bacterium]